LDFSNAQGDALVFTGSGASIEDFSITHGQRARLWVTQEDVLIVRHIPTGQDLWLLENQNNAITNVNIILDGVTYDLY
jgi:pantothenate kinase-related protein Tda10